MSGHDDKHILVVGGGSAGKRHGRNLAARGCQVSCVDPREDRRLDFNAETQVLGAYATIGEALQDADRFTGVVVASPPAYHVDQTCDALARSLPVLLEKPVSPTLESARRLQSSLAESGAPVLLGYTWRWWPPLIDVKRSLELSTLGSMRHVRFVMSAHLADWHPWEPYQDFFMSSRELGGGALLDESHWIDLALWFFGMPRSVSARIDKISDLEIDTDDNVDMILEYPDGLRITLHLDLYGRPHEKSIRFSGEHGTIFWTESPNRVAIGREASETWEEKHYDCERNDMFMAVTEEFLGVLDNGTPPTCTIEDGTRILRVIEAARESSESGRSVALDP